MRKSFQSITVNFQGDSMNGREYISSDMSHIKRFDYVKYDEKSMALQKAFKNAFLEMEGLIEKLKHGRATSLALTRLEEVYMWIGKAIRDEQRSERGIELLEERNNE